MGTKNESGSAVAERPMAKNTTRSKKKQEPRVEPKPPANDPTVQIKQQAKNAATFDTNVLLDYPELVEECIEKGYVVKVPYTVLNELDRQKTAYGRKGFLARRALKMIDEVSKKHPSNFSLEVKSSYKKLGALDKSNPDHNILATVNYMATNGYGFGNIDFYSNDLTVRLTSKQLLPKKVKAQSYHSRKPANMTDSFLYLKYLDDKFILSEESFGSWEDEKMNQRLGLDKTLNTDLKLLSSAYMDKYFLYSDEFGEIDENEGVVFRSPLCLLDEDRSNPKNRHKLIGQKKEDGYLYEYAAIRKGDFMRIINPEISLFGVTPYSPKEGEFAGCTNWHQAIAMAQILDPTIQFVFLMGDAGFGKTFLALAGGLELKHTSGNYDFINAIRVPLETRIGFLAGSRDAKIGGHAGSIISNMLSLHRVLITKYGDPDSQNKVTQVGSHIFSLISAMNPIKKNQVGFSRADILNRLRNLDIVCGISDELLGVDLENQYVIVDDTQNATVEEFDKILSRAGHFCKMILNGDVGQVETKDVDNYDRNPLFAAANYFRDNPKFANACFYGSPIQPRGDNADVIEGLKNLRNLHHR